MDLAALSRQLNPPQFAAVTHIDGPLLVFAGAGSGKTRVITYRIAHLVEDHNVAPWRVMAVTFTNKAASEMRERVARLVGPERSRSLWIATFHATGAKLLRQYAAEVGLRSDFAIYDDGDQRSVMNRVYEELKIDDKQLAPREVLNAIDAAKQEVVRPDEMLARATALRERVIAQAYASYEKRLAANNAVDFGDLLSRLVILLEGNDSVRDGLQERFRHVLVDEFQDTNNAQYRILRALVGPHKNLCVVGDDDQAIYRWRGADVRNLQHFRRDFTGARVIKLEQNYRSTRRILRAANAVISRSLSREGKTLFTENPEGDRLDVVLAEDERDEARQIALRVSGALRRGVSAREIAVFYRIHALSRPIEEAMRAANVPYVIVGGLRFYDRAEVKDLLAYLRLMLNPNDDVSLLRVINTPGRKIGKTTLDRVIARAAAIGSSVWKVIASGDHAPEVNAGARKALAGFYTLVSGLRKRAALMLNAPAELAAEVFDATGLREMLSDDSEIENEARRENVAELIGSMRAYQKETDEPSLTDYLERVTLSEATAEGDEGEKVSLMSVHSAKGLEFDTVFIAALEEKMFPYKGTELGDDVEQLEEERRLAYVAITRARKRLTVSYARFRQIFGETRVGLPSRFLTEIPEDVLSAPVQRRSLGEPRAYARPSAPSSSHGESFAREVVRHAQRHYESPAPREITVVRDPDYDRAAPDPEDLSPARGLAPKSRVRHARWGEGRVIMTSLDGAKATVNFPSVGTKMVLVQELRRLA